MSAPFDQLQKPKLVGDLAAGAIALLALAGSFSEFPVVKKVGQIAFFGSLTTLILNQFSAALYAQNAQALLKTELERNQSTNRTALQQAQTEIEALQSKDQNWKNLHEIQTQEMEELQADLDQALAYLKEKVFANAQMRQENSALQTQLQALAGQSTQTLKTFLETGRTTLQDAVTEWRDRLYREIDGKAQRRSIIADRLKGLKIESEVLAESFLPQIEQLDTLTNSPERLTDAVLSLSYQVNDQFSSLRVKFRNALNVGDRLEAGAESAKLLMRVSELESADVVPRSQYDEALSQLQARKEEILGQLMGHAEALETELNGDTEQYVQKLLRELDEANREIANLKQQVDEHSQPLTFSPATRDDLRMGNVIIGYFKSQGILLDRAFSDYRKWESVVFFHVDRGTKLHGKLVVPSELNEHSERLQPLLNCLNPPQFDWDSEQGLMRVRLQLSAKPKADASEIHKLWKRSTQFEAISSKWERVRVTGGSESGKSPTAENIAICILKHHPGAVKLANPMHDSQKNNWTIPATWTSHKESAQGLKELATSVEQRANGSESRDEFRLYLFDEVDSTMESQKSVSGLVKSSVKQASHQNLGAIFIGQNANVRNYKGMDRSDWNSAVNLHIGANSFDAIENSNLSSSEKTELKGKADKLKEFCESKNNELGLDSKDPEAYRFALVIEPGKKPYFLELPAFGTYTYNQISSAANPVQQMQYAAAPLSTPSLKVLPGNASNPAAFAADLPMCPQCSSQQIRSAGSSRGVKYCKCSDCGKRFAANK